MVIDQLEELCVESEIDAHINFAKQKTIETNMSHITIVDQQIVTNGCELSVASTIN